ncbi:MAG TPA: thioredoxin domain-containing protein [Gemmatimonadales bacterium]|jgi:protein-disulfide isomerase
MRFERLLSIGTNIAILAVLAYVAVRPGGLVSSAVGVAWQRYTQRRAISRDWDRLLAASSEFPGRSTASTVIVEFSDYQCPFCRRAHQGLGELMKANPQVQLRLVHFPLRIHPFADMAAKSSLCAERQGRFAEMDDRLFEAAPSWKEPVDWVTEARAAGVPDLGAFRSCLSDSQTVARLRLDAQLGREVDIRGTPTFVSRRDVLRGQPTDSTFAALVRGAGRWGIGSGPPHKLRLAP